MLTPLNEMKRFTWDTQKKSEYSFARDEHTTPAKEHPSLMAQLHESPTVQW